MANNSDKSMTDEKRFVESAQPHSWLLVAVNLHTQAVSLHKTSGKSVTSLLSNEDELKGQWDATNRSVFLLGGFAIENCLKAFLVYENPSWISNGKLSKELKTHSLTDLSSKVNQLPNPLHGQWVIHSFQNGLESWARYPCGLTAGDLGEEGVLTDRLWLGYLRLIGAYGSQLQDMLKRPWRGPHGFYGHYEFSGNFFATDIN
ncbi:hypothetical protein [Chromohalobacter israelensis]|uniref:hypothetical protein n=1 Tax=Chromohalobacter israelensis TaxID=141390 RepID=UPI00191C5714|nr:hypothetical protein [Chromohalobacter israelensis]MDF9434619.1 hypothetical protein [Chromohalobacter israelensis]